MSWVSGLFTTTHASKFTPEPNNDSTAFSDVQGYAVEGNKGTRTGQARQTFANMEEAEEMRQPYWQVWLYSLDQAWFEGALVVYD